MHTYAGNNHNAAHAGNCNRNDHSIRSAALLYYQQQHLLLNSKALHRQICNRHEQQTASTHQRWEVHEMGLASPPGHPLGTEEWLVLHPAQTTVKKLEGQQLEWWWSPHPGQQKCHLYQLQQQGTLQCCLLAGPLQSVALVSVCCRLGPTMLGTLMQVMGLSVQACVPIQACL